MNNATALVATPTASLYLQQLCKHWAHNLSVEYDAAQGRIIFPRDARGMDWPGDALLTLTATGEALCCRIDASSPGQLEGLKEAVARHLNRFAFREGELAFEWKDG